MVQPHAVLEVAYRILDLGVTAMISLQFKRLPVPVGDEAVIAVGGEESQLRTGRRKIEKLTRAIYRAQQLARSDIDGAVNALIKSGVQGLDQELVRTAVETYAPALPLTPQVSVEGILTQLSLFPDHQEAPDLTGIDLSLYVAPQFAEKVVAD